KFAAMIALSISFFSSMAPPPPRTYLFPYTTLFRSQIIDPIESRHVNGGELQAQESAAGSENPKRLAQREIDAGNVSYPERDGVRSEEHTSELQSQSNLVCRHLLEKKKLPIARSLQD